MTWSNVKRGFDSAVWEIRVIASFPSGTKHRFFPNSTHAPDLANAPKFRAVFQAPMCSAEQHSRAGGLRLALSEPRSGEFGQPPGTASSAGESAQPTAQPGVPFSLATFFWVGKRKYARAAARKTAPAKGNAPSARQGPPSFSPKNVSAKSRRPEGETVRRSMAALTSETPRTSSPPPAHSSPPKAPAPARGAYPPGR